ncbi:hypothetical protein GQX73_g10512 [Xylaria multiplex]|uniref:Uncharacterized protein n=1 Tax=Xylaria multiplex TaxID=323545 RepID=A0A7C8IJD6_9PEZI|nr:hypothetical protein GQX73_g10512 [Xylaria multiplex]
MESWREKPTPENHATLQTPRVDWDRLTKWDWPYSKLGYRDPNAIWSSLYSKFNCMPFAIQEQHGWHSDVCELARASDNKEQFEAALQKRRDERFKEIRAAWQKTRGQLSAYPHLLESLPTGPDHPHNSFCRISNSFSFDTIMGYFGNYLVDDPDASLEREYEAIRARDLGAADTASAPNSPSRFIEVPVASPIPTDQPNRSHQHTQDSASRPSRPSPPTPAVKIRKERVTRASKGSTCRSRAEKYTSKRRINNNKPREGVRRSARLRERAGRGSG